MRALPILMAALSIGCAEADSQTAGPSHHAATAWRPGPAEPVIDGLVSDWTAAERLASDTEGDAAAAVDVTELYATSRAARLFVRFDTRAGSNLYGGPASAAGLWLGIELPDGRELSLDFRGRLAQLDGSGDIPWSALGLVAAPSHAGRQHELRLDLSAFELAVGDAVRLRMWSSDGDEVVAPNKLVLRDGPALAVAGDPSRHAEARLRIASLNTREAGLLDSPREAAIKRLLRAAAADIYCLQELGSAPREEIAAALADVAPGKWRVHIVGAGEILGSAIVSRRALLPIPTGSVRFAGALVQGDPTVAVFDVHLKCCGYQGSSEDSERLDEADELADVIARFRRGELGTLLAEHADAPVLVVGDFNDVGSEALHTRLSASEDPGLSRWLLPHLQSPDVFTWISWSDGFPPAILDLLFHDPRLEPLHGYVLDSRELNAASLEQLALSPEDSRASDHLLLVADFR